MNFTLVTKEIKTMIPPSTVLFTDDVNNDYGQKHRIGEFKRIELVYDSDVEISGFNFYINIALFMPLGAINPISGKGNTYYACALPIIAPGASYEAYIASDVISELGPVKNFSVRFIADPDYYSGSYGGYSYYRFKIQIDFVMIKDIKGYLASTTNRDKLLKDAIDTPFELLPDNSNIGDFPVANNQYSEDGYSPRVYIYAEDPYEPFPGLSTFLEEKFPGFKAAFYDKSEEGGAPFFTDAHFKFIRGTDEVTNFLSYEPTKVEVYFTTPDLAKPINRVTMMIIRTDKNDDTVDFLTNYEADVAKIQGTGPSVGKIQTPMTSPTEQGVGTGIYMASATIDGVDPAGTYQIIATGYYVPMTFGEQGETGGTNTGDIPVQAIKVYAGEGFDVTGFISDYETEFEGNDLECAIEERMRTRIHLDFAANKWKNDILARFGIVTSNDIRRYLTKVDVLIYEEYTDLTLGGVVRNVFDQATALRISPLVYNPPVGLELDFSIANQADFKYSFRNRFEDFISNVQSYINGSPVLPLTNQDWGGKTLKIQMTLSFFYDDIPSPFTDNVVMTQQIRVKDYGEMAVKHITGEELDDTENVCLDDEVCYVGLLDDDLSNRKLIVNIIPNDTVITNTQEAEVWVGDQLPQLTTPKIIEEEEDYTDQFGGKAAKFCIDTTQLILGASYKISALAKRTGDAPPPCEFIEATGGTIYEGDGFKYHVFTDGTVDFITSCVPDGATIDVLVVAGGGGGGYGSFGAGGGAGGVKYLTAQAITVGSFPVVVGAGGTGGLVNGTDGGNSSFNGIISTGGGHGGGTGALVGGNGGSGGGGAGITSSAGGNGIAGQGFNGVNGSGLYGGGGGGASATGSGPNGGDGLSCSITGTAVYYGGGGGGFNSGGASGTGGLGGGGAINTNGTPNTGGGGGGASFVAGAGGSGIVIIRYAA